MGARILHPYITASVAHCHRMKQVWLYPGLRFKWLSFSRKDRTQPREQYGKILQCVYRVALPLIFPLW